MLPGALLSTDMQQFTAKWVSDFKEGPLWAAQGLDNI